MTFYPKKQKIKDLFFHFYNMNMDILLNNELHVMKFCTDVKTIQPSKISYAGMAY